MVASLLPVGFGAIVLLFIFYIEFACTQFPPPVTGQKELKTPGNPDVVVRYKEPTNEICKTRNPGQKQYSGYIHIPPSTLEDVHHDYPINTFFWFIEAQENPQDAPLTIWLNGGPGSSSILGMMNEVGPCIPTPANKESITTILRDFSWDGLSNLLFIDQPNKVGLSYDEPTNGSLALLDPSTQYLNEIAPPIDLQPTIDDIQLKNSSTTAYIEALRLTALMNGTFPTGDTHSTANTTAIAARAAWNFLQTWLTNFPQYNPNSTGVNLFAESYGGKYGPIFFEYFEQQNKRRESGDISTNDMVEIHVESLGIVNGCIDAEIQTPFWPRYANKNPYGIKALSDEDLKQLEEDFFGVDGARELIRKCRKAQENLDLKNFGDNDDVNSVCKKAQAASDKIMRDAYQTSGLNFYDIAALDKDSFPPSYHLEYLNNGTVQEAIGTTINFTESNTYVYNDFGKTGDIVRGGQVEAISYLLQNGVRVALIYGDRDYICNYQGGEAVSLVIDYPDKSKFRSAGYEDIKLGSKDKVYGQVRQHGNLSFTRLYQAGHLVPAYQPEAAYNVYERIINGVSISTGDKINSDYSTTGPQNSTQTLKAPPMSHPTCFLRAAGKTCNESQLEAIGMKIAKVYNGVVYLKDSDYVAPSPLPAYPSGLSKSNSGSDKGATTKSSSSYTEVPSLGALMVAIVFLVGLL